MAACGNAWWLHCWRSFWVLYTIVLRRFLCVDFLWNLVRNFRNPEWSLQRLLDLLPPWSTLAVAILTTLDNPGREWLQSNHWVSLLFSKRWWHSKTRSFSLPPRNGRLQALLDLLPPWSTLAVAVLTTFDNLGREWLQGNHWVSLLSTRGWWHSRTRSFPSPV